MKKTIVGFLIFFSILISLDWKNLNSKSPSYLGECKGLDYKTFDNCYGKVIYLNGDKYEGEFRNGRPNGKGIFTFKDGDKYEGDFLKGDPHGKVIWTAKNGYKYDGYFQYGKRHGKALEETENSKCEVKYDSDKITYNSCWIYEEEDNKYSNYWWAIILIIAVTFFIYTQTGKELKLENKNSFSKKFISWFSLKDKKNNKKKENFKDYLG